MSTIQKPNTPYKTSDLYYAAYLKVAGCNFVGIEKEGGRSLFLFEDQDGMTELRNQFFNNTAKVPARSYAEEIKAFKSLVHQ